MLSRRTTLGLALLLALCAARSPDAFGQRQAATKPADAAAGGQVGFRLKGLDGKVYDTSAMRGEVLVVSFGATWCTPCTWELVAIEELKEEYAGKPVKFLWVSIEDPKQTSNNLLRHYAKERGLTVPVLRDPAGEAFRQFSTSTRIPVVAFFDRGGQFDAPAHRGMSQEISEYKKMVRRRVDALLAAPAAGTRGGAAGAAPN